MYLQLLIMNAINNPNSRLLQVQKASGELEPFDITKLERSLRNAGADDSLIHEILKDILAWIHEGASTRNIYTRAFAILKREQSIAGLRYKLKKSILDMGPAGYAFEKLVGILFEQQGFTVQTGQVIEGHCITHEVDVIATGKGKQILGECKHSQDQGKQVSIQVPLYVRSRMDDIIKLRSAYDQYQGYVFEPWVITNTRFTTDSLQYGKCCGLRLMAWDYPAGNSLKELIERGRIWPITLLGQMLQKEKQFLLDQGIITCRQLKEDPGALHNMGFSLKKQAAIQKELDLILTLTDI
jgi:hypothetical protein